MEDQYRERFEAKDGPQTSDGQSGFEIVAITSGNGNGWQFPVEALQASLALWDGVESYIDHAQQPGWNRSVRDLAGICQSPQWDENRQGIKLLLHPAGPGAELLKDWDRNGWLDQIPGVTWVFRRTSRSQPTGRSSARS